MLIFYYLPTYNQHILGFVIWVVIYDLGLSNLANYYTQAQLSQQSVITQYVL
jgi:hypothetical protein